MSSALNIQNNSNLEQPANVNIAAPGTPTRVQQEEIALLRVLLEVEAEVRDATNTDQWKYVVANETCKLTCAKQVFVLLGNLNPKVIAISGLTNFEQSSQMVCGIEKSVSDRPGIEIDSSAGGISLTEFESTGSELLDGYPFTYFLWVPFNVRNEVNLGGMLLASDKQYNDSDRAISKRLAGTFGHALGYLTLQPSLIEGIKEKLSFDKSTTIAIVMLVLAALIFPVSMSTLAPFEVAPYDAIIVAAPFEGVIDKILVEPNQVVQKGDVLAVFSDTVLKNESDLAQRQIRVAQSELKKAGQLAFDNQSGQQQLRVAIANYKLKLTEGKFAKDLLNRATINAQRGGLVLFADKRSLIGRPVKLGERIMQIADPQQIELLVDVTVNDAIILRSKARVKIFLDSDPVNAREAVVKYIDYKARERVGGVLSFRVVAKLLKGQGQIPRVGVRGTAQLYGKYVPFAFYVFRRPLTTIRQWIGI